VKTVEFLVRNERIEPNKLDRFGVSGLQMAVASNEIDIVSCMIQSERVDPNVHCAGNSAFNIAVAHNEIDIVSRMLQSKRVDPSKFGSNPEMVKLLLESGKIIPPTEE
jgi:ankyrin repeat protein